nr:metallocarboxypeptidase inhibitor [Tanacetum cinerariifolium]
MSVVNQNSADAWRRAIKIGLYTKRKLSFIEGIVLRLTTDANLAKLWDTCNNMVICWILGKYKLNKDTYAISQSGGLISEYFYTKKKYVWEEPNNVNMLPPINVTLEISVFLSALNQQKEWRLIQFLNGLDEHYRNLRSQLLAVDGPIAKRGKCMLYVEGRSKSRSKELNPRARKREPGELIPEPFVLFHSRAISFLSVGLCHPLEQGRGRGREREEAAVAPHELLTRMPQLHTSLHFLLTPIVMINGSSRHDLLLNSQNFYRSIPVGAENPSLSRLCYRRLWGSRNRRALILGWAYYLDAFRSYPLRTWLPSVYRGHDN